MPTRKPPKELDPHWLKRATVQINSRIPLALRLELDEYLAFMSQPFDRRPDNTNVWPRTISGTIEEALHQYLESHPRTEKRGPKGKKDYSTVKKTSKIKPKTVEMEDGEVVIPTNE